MTALILFLAQPLISILARHVLLPEIDVGKEVGDQKNVAVGALEAAISVAVGLKQLREIVSGFGVCKCSHRKLLVSATVFIPIIVR